MMQSLSGVVGVSVAAAAAGAAGVSVVGAVAGVSVVEVVSAVSGGNKIILQTICESSAIQKSPSELTHYSDGDFSMEPNKPIGDMIKGMSYVSERCSKTCVLSPFR